MNTSAHSNPNSQQATFATSTATHLASVGFAAMMTLAVLLGVDGLAQVDSQAVHAQMAKTSAPAAAASSQS